MTTMQAVSYEALIQTLSLGQVMALVVAHTSKSTVVETISDIEATRPTTLTDLESVRLTIAA